MHHGHNTHTHAQWADIRTDGVNHRHHHHHRHHWGHQRTFTSTSSSTQDTLARRHQRQLWLSRWMPYHRRTENGVKTSPTAVQPFSSKTANRKQDLHCCYPDELWVVTGRRRSRSRRLGRSSWPPVPTPSHWIPGNLSLGPASVGKTPSFHSKYE